MKNIFNFTTLSSFAKALLFSILYFLLIPIIFGQQYPQSLPNLPPNIPKFNCGPIKKASLTAPVLNGTVTRNTLSPGCTGQGTKFLSVNIHYMLLDDGTGNFSETNDGYPVSDPNHRAGVTGYNRAQTVINLANQNWNNSVINWHSPSGTPALPKRIQLVLKNVYFHHNTVALNQTFLGNADFYDIVNNYGVNTATEINVFMTRDVAPNGTSISGETQVENTTYNVYGYLAIFMKDWDLWYPTNGWDTGAGYTINHEIGHTLGIKHDFENPTQFPDLLYYPVHPPDHNQGCAFYVGASGDWCNDWTHISNNLMTGSSYDRTLSPNQITKIHADLESFLSPYIDHCECTTIPHSSFSLNPYSACIAQNPGIMLDARYSTNYTKYDLKICEVANAYSVSCIGNSYDSGWLNGQIPLPTQSGAIDLSSLFYFGSSTSKNRYYMISVSVDNDQCPGANTYVQYFTSLKCSSPLLLTYSPNPATNTVTIDYTLSQKSTLSINLHNFTGNLIASLQPLNSTEAGQYSKTFDVSNLPTGQHYIVIMLDGVAFKYPLIVHH